MRIFIREIIETIILSLLLFVCIQFVGQSFQVEGTSMRPTLVQGQYLIVNKLVYRHISLEEAGGATDHTDGYIGHYFPFHAPRAGEVVVFNSPQYPGRDFVKRIIGVPGDTVEIRRGQVFINGEQIDEPYIIEDSDDDMDPVTVAPNAYFVLGDNRRNSADSRNWGTVPLENMIGVAWLRYWPPHEIGVLTDTDGVGTASAASTRAE